MKGKILIVSSVVFLLFGCGGTTVHRLYDRLSVGPKLPNAQRKWYKITSLEVPRELGIISLDGTKSDAFSTTSTHVFELLPGAHEIKVDYSQFLGDLHGHAIDLTWEAAPGHRYVIKYETKIPWWSAWVEDMGVIKTHEYILSYPLSLLRAQKEQKEDQGGKGN